jgi:glycosyltransferase involved in cell wall biosynthesis
MKICRIDRPSLNALMMKFPQREFHILNRLEEKGHTIVRHRIHPVRIPSKYLSYGIGSILSIARFKRSACDVLIADNIESAAAAMLIKLIYRTPFVFDFIDDYSAITRQDGFRFRHILIRIFERLLPRLADAVIVVDEHKRRYALSLGIKKEKIVFVPVGTDTGKFCADIQPVNPIGHDTPGNNRIVLYAGKINKYYCHETIIEAVPHVLKKFPDVKFVLIGDGDNVRSLKDLCRKLGIDGAVVFTGFKEPEEIPSFIASADICVFPIPDSSALAIYEYMACGKPAVVPDGSNGKMGINNDLIPTDCLARAENSPQGFADTINRLFADSRLREKISSNARKFAESFDWNDLASRYETALKQVVINVRNH